MGPISRKRTSSSLDNDDFAGENKRRRIDTFHSQNTSSEYTNVAEAPQFDDGIRKLLMRSVALTLSHIGFTGAQPEALEAICFQVETYALHFLSKITSSMLNARRAQSTPLDFKYALQEFSLPLVSLEPHLQPPIDRSRLRLNFELLPSVRFDPPSSNMLVANELSGEPDKLSKRYVPRKFPVFPSKHTYKWTEQPPIRETDPRKIREQAAEEARHAEEALRHIHNIEKASKEKNVKKAAAKDPKSRERHELWEKTMEDLLADKQKTQPGNIRQSHDHGIIVNAEARYFRKGASTKKNTSLELLAND